MKRSAFQLLAQRHLAVVVLASISAIPRGALAAAPGAGTAAAPATESATASATDRPRVLYRQAETAYAAGKVDEARQLLLEAWNIRQTYDVAAALGQAELELKQYRDAAEHLDFAVRNFAPLESQAALDGIKSDLRSAKSQVAEVRVVVSEPGATVSVNGSAVGRAPLAASIFLEPGTHAFGAKLAPDRSLDRRMALARGGTYDLELVLPPGNARAQDSAPSSTSIEYTAPIVTSVVGGLALGAGVALLVIASSKDQEREDLLADLPGSNPCGAGSSASSPCEEVSDLASSAAHLRTGAIVSFGAALGAGVATYLLWPKGEASDATALRAVPIFSPENGSFQLSASGRF